MKLFGFEIRRPLQDEKQESIKSFTPPIKDDGAVVVSAGGAYGTYVDLAGSSRGEAELVSKYRDMSVQWEIDLAIDDIINEAIVVEDENPVVTLNLDAVELDESVKAILSHEFSEILRLLEFPEKSYDVFRRWYIDGRIYYHAIVDEKNPQSGILELRYVDPRKIRKMKEVKRTNIQGAPGGVMTQKVAAEYFMYSEEGFDSKAGGGVTTATTGVKIAKDSILHTTSGLVDSQGKLVLGYLHKAILPLNQLRALEAATVIYRLARAPERRIFYIDVGSLPMVKAEQYVHDMMTKYKNKPVYDQSTGELRDDRRFMTMLEDFWLPRREGGRGTEITTLPGGQNLGVMEDVLYFQKRLYKALNVPISRIDPENSPFALGRSNEITRDEVKFARFIDRLRARFSGLFKSALERQVVLKNIMTPEQWDSVAGKIYFRFARDNYFSELKEMEILREKVGTVNEMAPFLGKYYSHNWARRNILKQDEEQIQLEDQIIASEMGNPQFMSPEELMMAQEQAQAPPPGKGGKNK